MKQRIEATTKESKDEAITKKVLLDTHGRAQGATISDTALSSKNRGHHKNTGETQKMEEIKKRLEKFIKINEVLSEIEEKSKTLEKN